MLKDNDNFIAMLVSILEVAVLYILKIVANILNWEEDIQILIYSALIAINIMILCLTFVTKKNLNEVLQYNPYGKENKRREKRYRKWFYNLLDSGRHIKKFILIISFMVIVEVLLYFFKSSIQGGVLICDIVLDIASAVGIGSAIAQIYINNLMKRHMDEEKKSHSS